MDLIKSNIKIKYIKILLVGFYSVGILGFTLPQTRQLFIWLVPFALSLTFVLLMFYHNSGFKQILVMLLIAILGFVIEIIGVETGIIFGSYSYGSALGPKFMDTPYFIGLNWLMLSYCAYCIFNKKIKHGVFLMLVGGLLVTLFDFLMEPVAIELNMWTWQNGVIPFKNYLVWFILSSLFIGLLHLSGRGNNKLASWVFFTQMAFFAIMNVLIRFV